MTRDLDSHGGENIAGADGGSDSVAQQQQQQRYVMDEADAVLMLKLAGDYGVLHESLIWSRGGFLRKYSAKEQLERIEERLGFSLRSVDEGY